MYFFKSQDVLYFVVYVVSSDHSGSGGYELVSALADSGDLKYIRVSLFPPLEDVSRKSINWVSLCGSTPRKELV